MEKRTLTPFGLEVKKRLLEMGLTQKEFCRRHGIPATRFSEILYGATPGRKYVQKIAQVLNLTLKQEKVKKKKGNAAGK